MPKFLCRYPRFLVLFLFVGVLKPDIAQAEIIPAIDSPSFGWVRGTPNSTFSGWDVFSNETNLDTILDSTPDLVGQFGPSAVVRETSGLGIVLGSGNIYGLSGATTFIVDQPGLNLGPSATSRIVAQFQTLGNELRYDNIRLSGSGFSNLAPMFTQELSRSAFGMQGQPGSGANVVYLAGWDLNQNIGNYSIAFESAASAMSLGRFQLDTFATATAVPEPTSIAMVVAFVTGFTVFRSKRWMSRFKVLS